jgi:ADP-ribose pyrophosphatase YjhB (NUDIX family)
MVMLQNALSKLWRRVPRRVRRWGVLLTESRFTVTAGAIITDALGRVLLLQHRFRPGGGWGIPGGFVNPGEQPDEALRRELREETGLEIDAPRLVFVRTLHNYRQIEIIFHGRSNGNAIPQGFEISRAEWFALPALPESLSCDQRELIERALNQRRER